MSNSGSAQAEKKIRKYIQGRMGIWRVLAWLTFLGMLAMLSMCTFFAKSDSSEDAKRFDPLKSGNSDYVYVDVIGISDWFYKYTVNSSVQYFYVAMDNEGYRYIFRMTPNEHKQLKAQNDWWNSEDTENPPAPERLYGGVNSIPSDKLSDFAGAFEMSEAEFKDWFGDKYFDAGSSPAKNSNAMYAVFAGLLGVMWLMCAAISRTVVGGSKKSIKALKARGELEQAAAELDAPDSIVLGRERGRATAHYLFGRGTGTVLRYDDIIWFYDSQSYYGRNRVASYIVANTADRKRINAVNLGSGRDTQLIDRISGIVLERNPDAMFGISKQNRKEYKQLAAQARAEKK